MQGARRSSDTKSAAARVVNASFAVRSTDLFECGDAAADTRRNRVTANGQLQENGRVTD
jgi:hypothetical protein